MTARSCAPTFSTLGSLRDVRSGDERSRQCSRIEVDGVEDVVDQKVHKEPYGVILDLDLAIVYGSSTQSVLAETQYGC